MISPLVLLSCPHIHSFIELNYIFNWILTLTGTDVGSVHSVHVDRSNHPTVVSYFIHSRGIPAGPIFRQNRT